MDKDLTLDSLSFIGTSFEETGSVRKEVSRGASLPEILTIRHSTVVDSASKRKSRRSVVRVDRHLAMTDGEILPVATWVVHQSPIDAAVTSAEIVATAQRITSLLSDEATSGLDLKEEIFAGGQQ